MIHSGKPRYEKTIFESVQFFYVHPVFSVNLLQVMPEIKMINLFL